MFPGSIRAAATRAPPDVPARLLLPDARRDASPRRCPPYAFGECFRPVHGRTSCPGPPSRNGPQTLQRMAAAGAERQRPLSGQGRATDHGRTTAVAPNARRIVSGTRGMAAGPGAGPRLRLRTRGLWRAPCFPLIMKHIPKLTGETSCTINPRVMRPLKAVGTGPDSGHRTVRSSATAATGRHAGTAGTGWTGSPAAFPTATDRTREKARAGAAATDSATACRTAGDSAGTGQERANAVATAGSGARALPGSPARRCVPRAGRLSPPPDVSAAGRCSGRRRPCPRARPPDTGAAVQEVPSSVPLLRAPWPTSPRCGGPSPSGMRRGSQCR